MTIPANAKSLGERLPSKNEQEAAKHLRQIVAAYAAGKARINVATATTEKPIELTLTPALSEILIDLLRYISSGDSVTLVPYSKMLTTQQAADILNVSRPYLISLLEKGDIPHEMVGRHRRIKAEDLFTYKRKRDEARSKALSEMLAMDAELI